MTRKIAELRRRLHIARRCASRLRPGEEPEMLAAAIDALPSTDLLEELPHAYRDLIETALEEVYRGA